MNNPVSGKIIKILLATILCLGCWHVYSALQSTPLEQVSTQDKSTQDKSTQDKFDVESFWQGEKAVLARYDAMDKESIHNTLNAIDTIIEDQKRYVPVFIDDVYSLRSQAGLGCRVISDKMNKWFGDGTATKTSQFISRKWAAHFLTDEELYAEIMAELDGLRVKLEGNRNLLALELLADLKSVSEIGSFNIHIDDHKFRDTFNEMIKSNTDLVLVKGVQYEAVALIGSEAAAYATTQLITSFLTTLSTRAALTGSAVSSGWTTLGISLVVAIYVDYKISEKGREEMENMLDNGFDQLKRAIIQGHGEMVGIAEMLENNYVEYRYDMHGAVYSALNQTINRR